MTYRELQRRIQRCYGERQATLLSQHAALVTVMNHVLGGPTSGGPKAKDPDRVDVTAGAQTLEQAIAAMNGMLRMA